MKDQYFIEPFREYSDRDLLCLIIGGSQHRATELAQNLLEDFGDLSTLAQSDPYGILQTKGIGRAVAMRIHAGLRAGRRALFPQLKYCPINDPDAAYARLWPMMECRPEESLWALYLNRKRRLLQQRKITEGSYAYTIVEPSQVYHHAIQCRAACIILAHNHPSGDPTPSAQDIQITDRMAQAGMLLNIPLLDHLIIGKNDYRSLAVCGILPSWPSETPLFSSETTI